MTTNGKIIGALLIGAAAGAVLGLLFAPSKGSELRQKIKDSTGDLADELSEKIKEGKDALSGLKERMMSEAEDHKMS
ncbi:MAG: YtxH domain-containing protein [Bacteroidota bacterium]